MLHKNGNVNGGVKQPLPLLAAAREQVWRVGDEVFAEQSLPSAAQSHARSARCFLSLHRAGRCGVVGVMYTEPAWHGNEIITNYTHSCVKYLFS